MLSSSGFCNDSSLLHPQGEEGLAECVIDFVGAGVVQVLALQPNLGASELFAESSRVIQR
jgi:hypothetical protein